MKPTSLCETLRATLRCSASLESMVADLLKAYADVKRDELGVRRLIIEAVALESRNHATMLEMLAEPLALGSEPPCKELVGEPWRVVEELAAEVRRGAAVGLRDFVERQAWVEGAVGEETYHRVLLPLIREAMRLGCVSEAWAELADKILSKIVSDETWHEEALRWLLAR